MTSSKAVLDDVLIHPRGADGCSMVLKQRGTQKESKTQRRQRRQENAAGKQKIITTVVPALIALFIVIAAFIYFATRR